MKVFIVVDAQNDFIDGALGTIAAEKAVPKICNYLTETANFNKDKVFLTRDTHYYEDYAESIEGQKLPIEHCMYGTRGWKNHPDVLKVTDNFKNRIILNKLTFGSYLMPNYLIREEDEIDEIIFMGFCTDICVISNVLIIKSIFPDIPIKVVADCCAGTTKEKHQAALDVMKSCHIDII